MASTSAFDIRQYVIDILNTEYADGTVGVFNGPNIGQDGFRFIEVGNIEWDTTEYVAIGGGGNSDQQEIFSIDVFIVDKSADGDFEDSAAAVKAIYDRLDEMVKEDEDFDGLLNHFAICVPGQLVMVYESDRYRGAGMVVKLVVSNLIIE